MKNWQKPSEKKSQSLKRYAGRGALKRLLAVWHWIDHWALPNIGVVGLHALLQSLVYIPSCY